MNELIKSIGKFLSRDLMYVIGGVSFLLSSSYAFGLSFTIIESIAENTVITFLILGIAYVCGYINQEVLSLSPMLTTGKINNPNRFLKWSYKKFTNSEYQKPSNIEYIADRIKLYKVYKEEELKDFERIIALKHIGSAVGSNWLISSIILIISCLLKKENFIVWIFSIYLLFGSIALILFAWIKGMQQYVTMDELSKKKDNN